MVKSRLQGSRARILLTVLTIAVMIMIFCFSTEPAEKSDETSGVLARQVIGMLYPEYEFYPETQRLEVYDNVLEHVTDMGILALAKPASQERLGHAIRYLTAIRSRIHELQQQVRKGAEKMEELRVVSKAKILLIEKRHMTEDEAHGYIGREAMDHGLTRKRVAQQILEDLE